MVAGKTCRNEIFTYPKKRGEEAIITEIDTNWDCEEMIKDRSGKVEVKRQHKTCSSGQRTLQMHSRATSGSPCLRVCPSPSNRGRWVSLHSNRKPRIFWAFSTVEDYKQAQIRPVSSQLWLFLFALPLSSSFWWHNSPVDLITSPQFPFLHYHLSLTAFFSFFSLFCPQSQSISFCFLPFAVCCPAGLKLLADI